MSWFWEFFKLHPLLVLAVACLPIWGLIELIVWITPSKKDDRAWKMTRSVIFALLKLASRLKRGVGTFKK